MKRTSIVSVFGVGALAAVGLALGQGAASCKSTSAQSPSCCAPNASVAATEPCQESAATVAIAQPAAPSQDRAAQLEALLARRGTPAAPATPVAPPPPEPSLGLSAAIPPPPEPPAGAFPAEEPSQPKLRRAYRVQGQALDPHTKQRVEEEVARAQAEAHRASQDAHRELQRAQREMERAHRDMQRAHEQARADMERQLAKHARAAAPRAQGNSQRERELEARIAELESELARVRGGHDDDGDCTPERARVLLAPRVRAQVKTTQPHKIQMGTLGKLGALGGLGGHLEGVKILRVEPGQTRAIEIDGKKIKVRAQCGDAVECEESDDVEDVWFEDDGEDWDEEFEEFDGEWEDGEDESDDEADEDESSDDEVTWYAPEARSYSFWRDATAAQADAYQHGTAQQSYGNALGLAQTQGLGSLYAAAQASSSQDELRELLETMRSEVEDLRSTLADLRSEVQRRREARSEGVLR